MQLFDLELLVEEIILLFVRGNLLELVAKLGIGESQDSWLKDLIPFFTSGNLCLLSYD
jgi:hypothetical protein